MDILENTAYHHQEAIVYKRACTGAELNTATISARGIAAIR
jgi:hypothetical protein